MIHQRVRIVAVILFLGFISFCSGLFLLGWSGDYERKLPNDYRLIRTNASTTTIWKMSGSSYGDVVIPPNIVRLSVYDNTVIGATQYSKNSDFEEISVTGYFILDTNSGAVQVGMTQKDFVSGLQDREIIEDDELPKLGSPFWRW